MNDIFWMLNQKPLTLPQEIAMSDDPIRVLAGLSMRDAAKLFGATPRALRFYEDSGLVRALRDSANHRVYGSAARKRLFWINLLRGGGVPIRDIRTVLVAEQEQGCGAQCALEKLQAVRARLERELESVERAAEGLPQLPRLGAVDDAYAPASPPDQTAAARPAQSVKAGRAGA
jgi:DNA-binding transcriptional MerR regulator